MSTTDSLYARLGKSPMHNLSLIHQVFERSGDVFDGHLRIDAVLIEKIYAVGPQPLERSFNDQLNMIWFAVKPGKPASRLLVDIPTELGSDPDLISKRLDGLAEDPLVFERPVCLGTVEERNAAVVGRSENADHFRPVRYCGLVPPMHVLHAHSDRRHFQLAKQPSSRFSATGRLIVGPCSGVSGLPNRLVLRCSEGHTGPG